VTPEELAAIRERDTRLALSPEEAAEAIRDRHVLLAEVDRLTREAAIRDLAAEYKASSSSLLVYAGRIIENLLAEVDRLTAKQADAWHDVDSGGNYFGEQR